MLWIKKEHWVKGLWNRLRRYSFVLGGQVLQVKARANRVPPGEVTLDVSEDVSGAGAEW